MNYKERDKSYTMSILVYNRSGVLMKVVSLFSRRGYNIDALSVGETENPEKSRITIVIKGDRMIFEQIKRQVEKLFDVISVSEMTRSGSVQRELVLVKVNADLETRRSVLEVAELFKAKIIDVTRETMTMQLTGTLDKIDSFMDLIIPFGVVELARTGITALQRGPSSILNKTFE